MKRTIVLIACAFMMTTAACSSDNADDKAGNPVPVKVSKPQLREEFETVALSGSISSPEAPANVSFLVSGKVIQVGPREGDYVKKGQLLAAIDPADYQLPLEMAAAQAAAARVSFRRAEDEHRRMKMLYESKSLAPNDYMKYRAAYESSAQQYESARASEKRYRKQVSDTRLLAPVTGYVSKRSIEPGETAAQGRPVFEIVKLDHVEISVGVPETDIRLVRAGQRASVTLAALPGRTFEGSVCLVNVSADPGTRTFPARISVPNADHTLKIGMIAGVRIQGDKKVRMLLLPIEAVVRDPQGASMVYLFFPDQDRVYAKRVETGALYGKEIEIKKGLTADDLVVVAGQQRLRDGISVSAVRAEDTGAGR
jgi:RND family efflux transporter MFP subunit